MIDAAGADRSGAKLPSALRDQNITCRNFATISSGLYRFLCHYSPP
jgi:hypothetical protein